MLALLWPFLVYWLILFVVCYIIVEYAQTYLYDETTPTVGLKVGAGSLILAAFLTWTRTRYDTMLTDDLGQTVLQGIVWFGVFTLVFRFQPWHGFAIGVATMVIAAGIATLGVDSLLGTNQRPALRENLRTNKPVRSKAPAAAIPKALLKDAEKKPGTAEKSAP